MKQSDSRDLLLGIILLLALGVLAFFLIKWIVEVFPTIDKTVQAAVIAALVALFSVIFTFWKERSRSLREAHRDQKIKAYSQFYESMFSVLRASKNNSKYDESKLADEFFEIQKNILFYGSPKVIKNFSEFKLVSGNEEPQADEILKSVGRVLLAMRDDIGLSNSGLDELNIHQIYVTDDLQKLGQRR